MDQYLPYIIEAFVILGGIFGILKLTNNSTANTVGEKGDQIVDVVLDALDPDTNGGVGRTPDNQS